MIESGKSCVIATIDEDIQELEELARSAGFSVIYEVIQRRDKPSPSTFIGKGKLQDLKEVIEMRPVSAVLINAQLKPSQHYLLENELKVECIDRVRLVLNIFSQRASSKEARLQVEKATLEYEIPLLREWIHNAKSGEHPGFLGSGEYETDAYYELIRRRLAKIRRELGRLDINRGLKRSQRRKEGIRTISLAGYTNAGKSSLLYRISGKEAEVDNRMFSTLSTLSARLEDVSNEVIISDTIGFLADLPHFLIESFKGTIEEIFESDLVLLVIDSSDPMEEIRKKIATSTEILFPDVDPSRLIVVLSKIDLVDKGLKEIEETVKEAVPCRGIVNLSSSTGEGIDGLLEALRSFFDYPTMIEFVAPESPGLQSLISWLHDHARIDSIVYGRATRVTVRVREREAANIIKRIENLGGFALNLPEANLITNH